MDLLAHPEGRLAIALGIGLVIGAERERRNVDKRESAGIRTFAIVALLGGVAAQVGSTALLVAVGVVVGGLAIAGYLMGDREDPGFTTEVALVLAYCLGALADRAPQVALATGLSAAMILALRTHLHSAIRTVLTDEELRDALLFGIAAVVVLPLVPDHTIDRFGVVNPFTLWRLVVVLMGMSGIGYIAQRAIGPRYGLALAGLAAGFVSSSATIASMGARARGEGDLLRPAIAGAAASTVATYVLLAILIGTADPTLLALLAGPLAAGGLTALIYAAAQTWRARRVDAGATRGRAFKLSTAFAFALLVTAIGFASALARDWIGSAGAIAASAIAGFGDTHAAAAATSSLAAAGQLARGDAAFAILLAVTTNTGTKLVLAVASGPRSYGRGVGLGLVLVLVVTWAVALATLGTF